MRGEPIVLRSRNKAATRPLALAIAAGALFAALAAVPAAADEGRRERARTLFLQGKSHYEQGRYREAIAAFQAAGKVQPSPLLDFNIGRCHDKLGQPKAAVVHYQRYLQGRPGAANRDEVQARIEALQATKPQPDIYDDLEQKPPAADPTSAPASQPAVELDPLAAASQPAVGSHAGTTASSPEDPAMAAGRSRTEAGPAEPEHEAARVQPLRDARQQPRRRPLTSDPWEAREGGPLYKQWWFWVAIAGGAVISAFIIATAVDGHDVKPHATGGLHIAF